MKIPKGKLLEQVFDDMSAMAVPAHSLIMDYVEGKPVNFNRLENYISNALRLTDTLGQKGSLIDGCLGELFEAME